MKKLGHFLRNFASDESGISSVEYALLLAFVAGGIILAADNLGGAVGDSIQNASDCVDGTKTAGAC